MTDSMKYRPHRGGLAEAMEESALLEPTMDALREHLSVDSKWFDPSSVSVGKYSDTRDSRIGWDKTFIVMAKYRDGRTCPVGFVDVMPKKDGKDYGSL